MVRRVFSLLALSLLVLTPLQAAENDITVAQYLAAWDALDHTALHQELETTGTTDFDKHPNLAIVVRKLEAVADAYRAANKADLAAGRTPQACLPEVEAELTTSVLIPHLRSYVPTARGDMTLAQAFAELMGKTYPCG
jgi:hypothetical protein